MRKLLQFSRYEKQSHSPARINDIVEETVSLTIIQRDQITLDVPEDLPENKGRSQQIQQVLVKLMINARDALNTRVSIWSCRWTTAGLWRRPLAPSKGEKGTTQPR